MTWPPTTISKNGFDDGTDSVSEAQPFLYLMGVAINNILQSYNVPNGVAPLDEDGYISNAKIQTKRLRFVYCNPNGQPLIIPQGWTITRQSTGTYRINWTENKNYIFVAVTDSKFLGAADLYMDPYSGTSSAGKYAIIHIEKHSDGSETPEQWMAIAVEI